MKVALVCPYAWDRFGGVQTHVRSLASALRKRDHEVMVIAPSAGEVGDSEPGIRIVGRALPVPANGSVAPLSFGPLAAAGMRRELRDLAPDVIHIHEPLIPSLSLLALWNAEVPTVGTFHAAAESSAGYRMARPVLDRAARRLTVRTAVSNAARSLAATYFPGDFVITPNGIDIERFDKASAVAAPGGRTSILFFSRLEKRKGVDVLIRAASRLKDLDCEVVIAGAGPQERSARRTATTLGVEARFVGRVEEDELPDVYRSATIYCAPALGGESFGIVLLEAMAAGLPVACSDLPGFREVASDVAAFSAPGDADGLAANLRRLIGDPQERSAMGVRSRERVARYDWGALVVGVEKVYERAVSGA